MTETAVATPDPDDDRDWEGMFYKAMAAIPKAELNTLLMDIRKDHFDAANGPSIGRTAEGNIGMLLVLTDGVGKSLMDAWMAWHDHKCDAALNALMGWLIHQMMLLELFAPSFPQSVKDTEFFDHNHGDPDGS